MSLNVKVGGVWKSIAPYVKVAGAWKLTPEVYAKVSGVWKNVFMAGGWIDPTSIEISMRADPAIVTDVKLQSDGKILVVGEFAKWAGRPAPAIIRLNSDGTLDTAFVANVAMSFPEGNTASAYSVAVQSDGKIVVGGDFPQVTFGGVDVSYLIRLNSDGTLDATFTANAGTVPQVFSVAIQSDGKIVAVGFSTEILRFNTDGTRDTTFITNAGVASTSGISYKVVIQSDGKILVGGDFTTWNGFAAQRIVRFNTDGTVDSAFSAAITVSSTIATIALQSDGKILIGGGFTTVNGVTAKGVSRLNSDGTKDSTFSTSLGSTGSVLSIFILSDGALIVGGSFTRWANSLQFHHIVRLSSTGANDSAFTAYSLVQDGSLTCIVQQPDGKFILSGSFVRWGFASGRGVGGLVRLNSDWSTPAFSGVDGIDGADESIYKSAATAATTLVMESVSTAPDGKIYVTGNFNAWSTQAAKGIVRLHPDTLIRDTTFPSVGFLGSGQRLTGVVVQPDGKIVVSVNGTAWNEPTYNGVTLARLNSDGTPDTAWMTNMIASNLTAVYRFVMRSDGKFVTVGLGGIFLVSSAGVKETTVAYNVISTAAGLALQSDGKILVGGGFTTVATVAANYIVRLNSDLSRDTAFTTNISTGPAGGVGSTQVNAIAIQSDGKILVGGDFTTWNGTAVGRIVRLNADGTRDTAFTTSVGSAANGIVRAIAIQSDGKILVGGAFTTWNGTTGKALVRLNSNGTQDTAFTTVLTGVTAGGSIGNGIDGTVYGLGFDKVGRILAVGTFTTVNSTVNAKGLVRVGGGPSA